ncbi:serine hydrolase domain-containing protein [Polymorphospora lycopeni]|uniref:Serine hydrolase domain-containing protein n=1 Tax=Polymorphospora lycopeni TaxID=3140240 RepID=A0ABV5CST4_9ACTN
MTRFVATVAAVVMVVGVAGCTGNQDVPGAQATTGGPAARCDPRLDGAFTAWARAGFSGSIAISTGGRFDCLAAYGSANDATHTPNTIDTVFSIGSVTKAFTAATIFDLVEEGRVALDDRVGRLLPELTGPVATVTVRQLLSHTSGLNGSHGSDHQALDRDAALASIAGLDLAFPSGSGHLYSNAGYTLLALVIERVSGATYREYTASRILRLPDGRGAGGFWDGTPAAPGPRAVGYLDDGTTGEPGDFAGPHWAMDGSGGLAMTAHDLAVWTHALFTGQVVAPESVEVISAPGHDLGAGRSETPGWVASDASVLGVPFLATAGGDDQIGHNAVVAWVPERQRVVAMASNKPGISAEDLLATVGPALLAGEPLPTPGPPAAGAGPAATVGKYRLDGGGSFDVTAAGNQVTVAATGVDAVTALFPPGGRVSSDDVRAHDERVLALLDGRTREGREERGSLEEDLGPISGVALAGTVFRDGELRTYVTLVAGSGAVTGWYAVNAEGGIEAAEVPAGPPTLKLVPAGGDRYRPDDPTGVGPEVTVEFRDGRMTVSGPAGTAVAELAG